MKADGINPEELLGNSSAAAPRAGKKRQPRPAKYKFIDVNGETKTLDRSGPYTEANRSGAGRR